MRLSAVAATSLCAFISALTSAPIAQAAPELRVSGPVVHENLAIYFIHGPSKAGAAPLTLAEALSQKLVQVRETSHVNSLEIENLGDQPVFVQAGDIVKGGKQDRTIAVSLLLPPKSGRIPIASFCVEAHRWSPRGDENGQYFTSAAAAVPSRDLKMAIQGAPPKTASTGAGNAMNNNLGASQMMVWDSVRAAQERLTSSTGTDVRSKVSDSSLQLALENKKLVEMRAAYLGALAKAADKDSDIVGYVFAVNGKLNSGDVYMSNALFKKMWPKMLEASAIEAISLRNDDKTKPPTIAAVEELLAEADKGARHEDATAFGMRRVMSANENALFVEADLKNGALLHRSYLAR